MKARPTPGSAGLRQRRRERQEGDSLRPREPGVHRRAIERDDEQVATTRPSSSATKSRRRLVDSSRNSRRSSSVTLRRRRPTSRRSATAPGDPAARGRAASPRRCPPTRPGGRRRRRVGGSGAASPGSPARAGAPNESRNQASTSCGSVARDERVVRVAARVDPARRRGRVEVAHELGLLDRVAGGLDPACSGPSLVARAAPSRYPMSLAVADRDHTGASVDAARAPRPPRGSRRSRAAAARPRGAACVALLEQLAASSRCSSANG